MTTRQVLTLAATLVGLALLSPAAANSLCVNLAVWPVVDPQIVDPGETSIIGIAGAESVDGAHWNNIDLRGVGSAGAPTVFTAATQGGNHLDLIDSTGTDSGIDMTSAGAFFANFANVSTPNNTDTGDAALMQGFLNLNNTETISLSGLSTWAPDGYVVYAVFDIGPVTRTYGVSMTDGTTSQISWTADTNSTDADVNNDGIIEWKQTTATNSGTAITDANYAVFGTFTGDTLTISGDATSGRATLSGFQIVALHEPFVITTVTPDFTANQVSLTWNSDSGVAYQIEASNTLQESSWSPLGTPVMGTTAATTVTESDPDISTNPGRFYRVRVFEPLIQNHDFELPVTVEGVITSVINPPGWTFTAGGVFNPDGTQLQYTDMADAGPNGGVLPNMDGPTFAFMFLADGATGEMSQTTSATLAADTTYALTVAIGQRNYFNAGQISKDFRIALETATTNTVVAELTGDLLNENPFDLTQNATGSITLAESTFTDFSAMATTSASPIGLGENLILRIQALADGRYLDVDNVRLSISSAP